MYLNMFVPLILIKVWFLAKDKVHQWLMTCQWFSPSTPVPSTNKSDCNNITGMMLNETLSSYLPQNIFYYQIIRWTGIKTKSTIIDLYENKSEVMDIILPCLIY
jgi:hypothetical protein